MATSDTTRVLLEEMKGDTKERGYLYDSLQTVWKEKSDLAQSKAKLTQGMKAQATRAAAAYQQARDAGTSAANVKALVEYAKLMAQSPVDFAKAATSPDPATLGKVKEAVGYKHGDATGEDVNRFAWQTFYEKLPSVQGKNLLGTYMEMESAFGKEQDAWVTPNDGHIYNTKKAVADKLATERQNMEDFRRRQQVLVDMDAAYREYVAGGGDPNDYDTFARSFGLDEQRLADTSDPAFIQQLQGIANNPEAYGDDLFREDIREAQTHLDDQEMYLKDRLNADDPKKGGPAAGQEDDWHWAAEFLSTEKGRAWAKDRGFEAGEVIPITPEIQKQIDEGKVSKSLVTPWGLYAGGPDWKRMKREAIADIQRPERGRLFEKMGLRPGIGKKREVYEITIEEDPATLKDPETGGWWIDEKGKYVDPTTVKSARITRQAVTEDGGIVGQRADGSYVWSTNAGETWAVIPPEAASKIVTRQTEGMQEVSDGAVGGLTKTTTPPKITKRTEIVEKMPMHVGDAPGSVRYINEYGENKVHEGPSMRIEGERTKTSIANKVGAASSKAFIEKQGFAPGTLDGGAEEDAADPAGDKLSRAERKKQFQKNADLAAKVPRLRGDGVGMNEKLEKVPLALPGEDDAAQAKAGRSTAGEITQGEVLGTDDKRRRPGLGAEQPGFHNYDSQPSPNAGQTMSRHTNPGGKKPPKDPGDGFGPIEWPDDRSSGPLGDDRYDTETTPTKSTRGDPRRNEFFKSRHPAKQPPVTE